MTFEALKVGELAKRTGLTVRTLHHYDEIGLLKPSMHTKAGYRLYTAADVVRLQQVLSLRQLGFSLEEVRDCLNRPGFAPLEATRQMQEEWADLIAEVRAEMDAGTDPKDAKVQALARRWVSMVQGTTGGDPAVEQALKRLWDEQGDTLAAQHGPRYDPRPVFGYITRAIAKQ